MKIWRFRWRYEYWSYCKPKKELTGSSETVQNQVDILNQTSFSINGVSVISDDSSWHLKTFSKRTVLLSFITWNYSTSSFNNPIAFKLCSLVWSFWLWRLNLTAIATSTLLLELIVFDSKNKFRAVFPSLKLPTPGSKIRSARVRCLTFNVLPSRCLLRQRLHCPENR